jgi:hypothetical protein
MSTSSHFTGGAVIGGWSMTLSNFAAIAEIVGAIAIVVTIIYLAIEVKHSRESLDANTKAIRGQAISDVTSNIADHMAMIVQGHDVANVIKRMGSDDSLEPNDALILDMTMTAVFIARQNEYYQWKSGLLEDAIFRSLHHITITVLSTKGGIHWWQNEGRNLVAPEFVEFTEKLLAEGSSDSLESWRRAIQLDKSEN